MDRLLTPSDFDNLGQLFEQTAVRWECQPAYRVDVEASAYAEFLAGVREPLGRYPFFAAWLEQIAAVTAAGRSVARIRVIDDPPTPYQEWEMFVTPENSAAGEDIRYLPRSLSHQLGIPDAQDWWIFDGQRLCLMRFDDNGVPGGGRFTDEPALLERHLSWWRLAQQHAIGPNDLGKAP